MYQPDIPHIYRSNDEGRSMLYAWFGAMHTRVDLVLVGNKERESLLLKAQAIRERINEIERIANCFDSQSELAVINRVAFDEIMPVSDELEYILAECLRYNRMTDGMFDVTVASADYDSNTIHNIILPCDGTVRFHRRGVRINLSGFIKGYAVEQVRCMLVAEGVTDALVNMGNSSILAMGGIKTGEGWSVRLSDDSTSPVVMLRNECLTTSGNDTATRRHIVNPSTGNFVMGCHRISVINGNAAEGEVLSTCLFIDESKRFPFFEPYRILT